MPARVRRERPAVRSRGAARAARARREPRGRPPARRAGSAAITAGLALLVLGLAEQPYALPAAGAAFAAFVLAERRASDPIAPGWALRRPGFARANGVALALTATTTPAMFLAILFQHEVLGRSALAAGLWCAPFNLAVVAGSLLGRRVGMAGGLAAIAAGAATLTTLQAWAIPVAFVLMGGGLGCASVASTASGTAALPDGEQGIASGVLNASAQIGSAVGVALIAGLGYRAGFLAAALVALAGAVTSVLIRKFGGTTGGCRVVPAVARHPRACWWHVTGCRVPAGAGRRRRVPSKF